MKYKWYTARWLSHLGARKGGRKTNIKPTVNLKKQVKGVIGRNEWINKGWYSAGNESVCNGIQCQAPHTTKIEEVFVWAMFAPVIEGTRDRPK